MNAAADAANKAAADAANRAAADAAIGDAELAALLLAEDPDGLGGIVLKARAGPARDNWLRALADAFPPGTPIRRMPVGIPDERLLGGLDLAATLSAGRPLRSAGLLAEADGGVIVVPMAERLPPETAARLAQVMDSGELPGVSGAPAPARFALVLLDEGVDDECVPAALAERLAIHLDLDRVGEGEAEAGPAAPTYLDSLCGVADVLGAGGIRAALQAVKVAQASADLAERAVCEADVAAAVRLVLAPRATRLPAAEPEPEAETPPEQQPPPPEDAGQDGPQREPTLDELTELAVEVARAMLPPGILEEQAGRAQRGSASGQGAGQLRNSPSSGRRAGVRQGRLGRGARLDLVETLKAAAPWQPVRRRERPGAEGVLVRQEDFRIRRLVRRAQSTTIFIVDASGSAALARLGEAKGAVELLLADSYVRRDEVALIAFRGEVAEVLLAPTRSLARAKRALQDLPGGGGTPLAAGLEAAAKLGAAVQAKGRSVTAVVLTDGRANVAREAGLDPMADAEAAGRAFRGLGLKSVFIDTSPRPRGEGARLAAAMGARLIALPRADAGTLAAVVKAA
jgi:magnesium chelatase subunit D